MLKDNTNKFHAVLFYFIYIHIHLLTMGAKATQILDNVRTRPEQKWRRARRKQYLIWKMLTTTRKINQIHSLVEPFSQTNLPQKCSFLSGGGGRHLVSVPRTKWRQIISHTPGPWGFAHVISSRRSHKSQNTIDIISWGSTQSDDLGIRLSYDVVYLFFTFETSRVDFENFDLSKSIT